MGGCPVLLGCTMDVKILQVYKMVKMCIYKVLGPLLKLRMWLCLQAALRLI